MTTTEYHNRPGGINFVGMDTALMAADALQFGNIRNMMVPNRSMMIHERQKTHFDGTSIPNDYEKGALARKNEAEILFKNTRENFYYRFYLEGRYVITQIRTEL